MMYGFGNWGSGFGFGGVMSITFILVLLWCLVWKGLALWHAAQRKQPWWFVAILLINTFGILEIIYLFGVAKMKSENLFKK